MSTIGFLVGALVGIFVRRLVDPWPQDGREPADDSARIRTLVCSTVGGAVLGVITGLAFTRSLTDPLSAALAIGSSCLLLTYCLFNSSTVALLRGQRTALGMAITNAVLGLAAATIGTTLGAIVPLS